MATFAHHKLVRISPCQTSHLYISPNNLPKQAHLNYPPCTRAFDEFVQKGRQTTLGDRFPAFRETMATER